VTVAVTATDKAGNTSAAKSISFTVSPAATTTGTATLTWSVPTLNTDGSSLSDLAGFHIYYGTSQSAMTQMVAVANAAATTYQVTNLAAGTWYFAITAYSTAGTESAKSNIGNKTIP